MRYRVDHDFHIHSTVSRCCHDPRQTEEAILRYGEENGFRKLCLTNHLWDERVPAIRPCDQDFRRISSVLPLPQGEHTKFAFGAETDLDKYLTLGVSPERMEALDLIIIPTTHLHLGGFTVEEGEIGNEARAALWTQRFAALFLMDLPWHKIGIAHLTCSHITNGSDPLAVLSLIPDETMYHLFRETAGRGAGIELNFDALHLTEETADAALRPYRIAKEAGCKFYLGSDAHRLESLMVAKENFTRMVTLLDLTEEDKFDFE